MVTAEQARELALSLAEAEEKPHHGFASFRVRGKIFATLPHDTELRIMCDEAGILTAVDAYPESCREYYWGKRLSCVAVNLPKAELATVTELLIDAWESRCH